MNNFLSITLDSIECKKIKEPTGPIKITSNNQIKDIKNAKMQDGTKGIRIRFNYNTRYLSNDEKIAFIEIEGNVMFNGKEHEKISEAWKEGKKLDPKSTINIINIILAESSIASILVANQLKLPAPIPMPRAKSVKTATPADTSYIE